MRRYGVFLFAVVFAVFVTAGVALAHVSSGPFNHSLETNASHSAGTGSFDCVASWVAVGGIHQSYDGNAHTASLWNRDYSSSATWSTSWGFNDFGNSKFWPRRFHRIDAATSNSSPIHFWWDLIYPRFKHGMSTWCSG